jgi:hypothetical protein
MKVVKSLLLGAAAGLMAVGGAQAADLPVKAKAVEYVKICSLYGTGFYYIPGTDTCIKLGGYVRVDVLGNSSSVAVAAVTGAGGAQNRYTNGYIWRSREDFNIDTRTATEYGVVRTFFDAVFTWTSGNYAGAGNGSTTYDAAPAGTSGSGSVAGGALGVYFAFIQFAGFTMGKAVSQFSAPWTNYPGNNFDNLVGGGGTSTGVNQFTYTADFGQGITAAISAQDQSQYYQSGLFNTSLSTATGVAAGGYGGNSYAGTISPDIVGMVRVDQAWGLFQASVAAHDNHAAYYTGAETSGHPDDKWGWAVALALSIKNIPTGAGDVVTIQGIYTNGASKYNFQDLSNNTYAMYGSSGLGGVYGSLGFGGVSDSVFAPGTSQQLTTTYGFRGAYTHNWNPFWNTSLYGAWAAVNYNGTAKALICTSPGVVALGAGLGCNPDFSIGQLGLITRWTPVKNLTFSADFQYDHLDQKFTGVAAIPVQAGIGKPAASYEMKDQNAYSLLLRAQRNW